MLLRAAQRNILDSVAFAAADDLAQAAHEALLALQCTVLFPKSHIKTDAAQWTHLRAAQRDDGQQHAAAAANNLAQAVHEALLALLPRLMLRHAVRGLHNHCNPHTVGSQALAQQLYLQQQICQDVGSLLRTMGHKILGYSRQHRPYDSRQRYQVLKLAA